MKICVAILNIPTVELSSSFILHNLSVSDCKHLGFLYNSNFTFLWSYPLDIYTYPTFWWLMGLILTDIGGGLKWPPWNHSSKCLLCVYPGSASSLQSSQNSHFVRSSRYSHFVPSMNYFPMTVDPLM